jgi:hypothetical protein
MRPKEVNVLGITYTIEYVSKPSDVDIYKRKSLWGQTDYWTNSIRVLEGELCDENVWGTIFEEVIHVIAQEFKIECLKDESNHGDLGLLAVALTDVLFRNGWIKTD